MNKIKKIRWRLVSDDDGHHYIIPADKENEFTEWLAEGPYWEDYEGEEFDGFRIDNPSCYTFTDPKAD